MKRVTIALCGFTALMVAGMGTASAAVLVQAGTQGFGLEYEEPLIPFFSAALQGNYLTFSHTFSTSDVTYDGNVHLMTIGLIGQYHPFDGDFHVDGGLYYNDSHVDAAPTSYTPNLFYRPETDRITFNKVGPYAGIGWLTSGLFKMSFDLGVLYQGDPRVSAADTCSGPLASQCEAKRQEFLGELRKKVSGYRFYPVVRVGLGF